MEPTLMTPAHRAVFFDRDGVVNVSPGAGYVTTWDAFHFSPGVIDALRLCKEKGYLTVLVTSQQGVGKGVMSQADLDNIHARMQAALHQENATFDGIYSCTHLAGTCTCRKPSAEMIHNAVKDLHIDTAHSLLIGDHDRDIQMAHNAGIPITIRIRGEKEITVPATTTLDSTTELQAALAQLL
ncbi:MAG: HAD-IIIA family hydrolase [Verrucomicrobiales bacterium]|nr:HAD-IIIA family hydrolase [Verrucomicrobiales bacterium]MCP5560448.1 HAD-IIIA family hydrolase [Verrucomicrobiaceae bacterium]